MSIENIALKFYCYYATLQIPTFSDRISVYNMYFVYFFLE